MLPLPNFLIVGAQKCGTTSLHDILTEHPEAGMSDVKEINFFTFEKKFKKGLDYYSTFFRGIDENAIAIGESSPGYICTPRVAERIHKKLGKIKIVIILRDPIKRAFSQYWDNRRHLNEYMTEVEIVSNYLEANYKPGRRGYFSRGVYAHQVEKYFKLFGKENVHVMILEELIKSQNKTLQELYSFLGLNIQKGLQKLPPPSNSSQVWTNSLYNFFLNNPGFVKYLPKRGKRILLFGGKQSIDYTLPNERIIEELKNFYRPFNQELSELIENPLKDWRR